MPTFLWVIGLLITAMLCALIGAAVGDCNNFGVYLQNSSEKRRQRRRTKHGREILKLMDEDPDGWDLDGRRYCGEKVIRECLLSKSDQRSVDEKIQEIKIKRARDKRAQEILKDG